MKKRYKIIIGVVVLLVAIRIYLPYGITKYVNKTLQEIPGYTGSITDVDLWIIKGSYSIDSLQIFKVDNQVRTPFFSSERIDLSVHWKALFDGAIVGEVDFITPSLTFVTAEDTSQTQYGEDVDWTEPLDELMPLKINRFSTVDGKIYLKNVQSEPKIDLYINDFNLTATNLSNAKSVEGTLPSDLNVKAYVIGGGSLSVEGKMNLIKQVPDLDLDMKIENIDITSLNDFLRVYANLDAEEGSFNLYSEIVVKDSQLEGYVKPLIRNLHVASWSGDKQKPLQLIWESVAGLVMEIFENQKKDQFATKVPIKGDLSSPNTKVGPAIWNILSNAFVEAFKKSTDDTLDFSEKGDEKQEDG